MGAEEEPLALRTFGLPIKDPIARTSGLHLLRVFYDMRSHTPFSCPFSVSPPPLPLRLVPDSKS